MNSLCLTQLTGQPNLYVSFDTGDEKCLDKVAPRRIAFKVGAVVILTTNIDISNKLVNGRAGVVRECNNDVISVLLNGDRSPISSPLAPPKVAGDNFPCVWRGQGQSQVLITNYKWTSPC